MGSFTNSNVQIYERCAESLDRLSPPFICLFFHSYVREGAQTPVKTERLLACLGTYSLFCSVYLDTTEGSKRSCNVQLLILSPLH